MTTAVDRPLRADARRNRDAVLQAARYVFARQGTDAQMDDIARRANVGVGTVYRHFPTKDALLQAVAMDHFARVTENALRAEQLDDPWEAFAQMLWGGAEAMAGDRAVAQVMSNHPEAMMAARTEQPELFATGARVMRRAQKAGVLRRDAVPEDIGIVMCGLCSTAHASHLPKDAWRRQLQLVLDGFRA